MYMVLSYDKIICITDLKRSRIHIYLGGVIVIDMIFLVFMLDRFKELTFQIYCFHYNPAKIATLAIAKMNSQDHLLFGLCRPSAVVPRLTSVVSQQFITSASPLQPLSQFQTNFTGICLGQSLPTFVKFKRFHADIWLLPPPKEKILNASFLQTTPIKYKCFSTNFPWTHLFQST